VDNTEAKDSRWFGAEGRTGTGFSLSSPFPFPLAGGEAGEGALLGSDSLGVLSATVMVGIASSPSVPLGCEGGAVEAVGAGGSPPTPLITADAVERVPLSAAPNVVKGGGLDVRLRQPLAVSLSTCRGFGEGERLVDPEPFLLTDKLEAGVDVEGNGAEGVSTLVEVEERAASAVEGPGTGPAEADSSGGVAVALLPSPALSFFFFSSASLRWCSS